MDIPDPNDSVAYDTWYDAIGRADTGGTTITLEEVRQRRDEILELADRYGATDIRLVDLIVHEPVPPETNVVFLIDWESRGSGLPFFAFADEMVRLLRHHVTVHRAANPEAPTFNESARL